MDKSITDIVGHVRNAETAYLRGEVETADPLKLLLLLYNRLIRELREIRDRLDQKAAGDDDAVLPPEIGVKFEKCRHILSYLIDSLNAEDEAEEVARRLHALYAHFFEKILQAQMEKDGRAIDDILPNLETLRDGWMEVSARGG